MRWNRSTAIFATIGAAATGYVAVVAYRRLTDGRGRRAPAHSESEQYAGKDINPTRAAGPDAMRDPPKEWTGADQASDESFPASDPPPVGSRVD